MKLRNIGKTISIISSEIENFLNLAGLFTQLIKYNTIIRIKNKLKIIVIKEPGKATIKIPFKITRKQVIGKLTEQGIEMRENFSPEKSIISILSDAISVNIH